MQPHEWISDVLADLGDYCQKNELTSTQALVDQAKRALWMDIKRLGSRCGTKTLQANLPKAPLKILHVDEESPIR